jgi:hypothetical protein
MLKLSWGYRIAILYIGFVALIGFMVILCINQRIDLVSDDYYEKELVFQNKINETNNANNLDEKITHTISDNALEILFPSSLKGVALTGDVLFFRPSDAAKDFKCSLSVDANNIQKIDLTKLTKGMYKMQVSWKANNTSYFAEQVIVIP